MEILELVADRVILRGVSAKSMVLPYCTWDKFGEILADGGGRSLGLFDELMSFFTEKCFVVLGVLGHCLYKVLSVQRMQEQNAHLPRDRRISKSK